MITGPTPPPRPGPDLSARPERQAAFHQLGHQPGHQPATPHAASRAAAGAAPPPATPPRTPALEVQPNGLRLPAMLLPGAAAATGPQAGALSVEVRLLAVGGAQPHPGAGQALTATVVGGAPGREIVLETAAHRLALPAGTVDLPLGATLTLQLHLPGNATPITSRGGLEQLIGTLLGAGAAGATAAAPAAAGAATLAPDARLAAGLVADWRALAARSFGKAGSVAGTPGANTSLELRVDGDSGRSMLVDRDTGWRALFGLLGEPAAPVQPVTLSRRERSPGKAGEAGDTEERLHLTLDLSRLGRIGIELVAAPGRLAVTITSPEPLPAPLRAGIGEAFAVAAELAGVEPALAFRAAPAQSAGLPDSPGNHLADWLG